MLGCNGGEYEGDSLLDVAPFRLAEVDRHFRGVYCLHHQSGRREAPLKRRFISARLHGITSRRLSVIFDISLGGSVLNPFNFVYFLWCSDLL
jgi:hypothetical protein